MKFQRYFLIFSQEDGGYGIGQAPSGYVKIEARDGKGRLSASVQNLQEDRDRLIYKLYILSADDKGTYPAYAGIIPLHKNKGELNWEFNPDDVAMTGKSIEAFNIAAVLAEYVDRENKDIHCPMAAYRNKKIAWRDRLRAVLYSTNQKSENTIKAEDNVNQAKKEQNSPEASAGRHEIFSKHEGDIESKYKGKSITKSMEQAPLEQLVSNDDGKSIPVTIETKPAEQKSSTDNEEIEVKISFGDEQEEEKEFVEYDSAEQDFLREENYADDDGMEIKITNANEAEKLKDNEQSEEVDSIDQATGEIKDEGEAQEQLDRGPDSPHFESGFSSFEEYKELLDKSINDELYGKNEEKFTGCLFSDNNASCPSQMVNQGVSQVNPCVNCYNRNIMNQINAEKGSANNVENLKKTLDKYFEVSDPFGSKRRDYRWWKVNSPVYLNNILYQCNIRTPLLFNPAVITAHFKYRHLIVGVYSDRVGSREYVVCGIPGVYGIDDKPFGDMCRWVQLEGSRPKYGAFGYWLVYIDPKTGKFLSLN